MALLGGRRALDGAPAAEGDDEPDRAVRPDALRLLHGDERRIGNGEAAVDEGVTVAHDRREVRRRRRRRLHRIGGGPVARAALAFGVPRPRVVADQKLIEGDVHIVGELRRRHEHVRHAVAAGDRVGRRQRLLRGEADRREVVVGEEAVEVDGGGEDALLEVVEERELRRDLLSGEPELPPPEPRPLERLGARADHQRGGAADGGAADQVEARAACLARPLLDRAHELRQVEPLDPAAVHAQDPQRPLLLRRARCRRGGSVRDRCPLRELLLLRRAAAALCLATRLRGLGRRRRRRRRRRRHIRRRPFVQRLLRRNFRLAPRAVLSDAATMLSHPRADHVCREQRRA